MTRLNYGTAVYESEEADIEEVGGGPTYEDVRDKAGQGIRGYAARLFALDLDHRRPLIPSEHIARISTFETIARRAGYRRA